MKLKMLKKAVVLGMVAFMAVSLFAGCGGGATGSDAGNGNGNGNGNDQPSGDATSPVMYQLAGSDSEVNVVQRLTEVFTETDSNIAFAVTGGGSGTGIASLVDGQIDVANSSREMRDEEIAAAQANGVDPRPFIFAQDGLAVVINDSLPIEELTVDELGAIFRGDITNWADVGGPDLEISLYGRQSTSGTYVYFMENVVKGDYSENKKMQSGSAAIVEGVMADGAGIGYTAIGYAVDSAGNERDGLRVLRVAPDAGSPAVTPLDLDNIMEGLYPIVRPLFHYVDGKAEGGLKAYLEFVVSAEGQAIVQEEGFFPIMDSHRQANMQVFE